MTDERFNEIRSMTDSEYELLSEDELKEYEDESFNREEERIQERLNAAVNTAVILYSTEQIRLIENALAVPGVANLLKVVYLFGVWDERKELVRNSFGKDGDL